MTDTAGYDEEFRKMTEGLDTPDDAQVTAFLDAAEQFLHEVENSSTVELVGMMKRVWYQLSALQEGLVPKTDKGRELHSQHTVLKIELLKRQADTK